MQFYSFLGFAAACATVTAAKAELSPLAGLKYDETSDWYRDHGMPSPEGAPEITIVELVKSYVVKLDCPDCPFLVRDGEKYEWVKRDSALVCSLQMFLWMTVNVQKAIEV